jgi:hypothetical protein
MSVVGDIIATCFSRFNALSTTKVQLTQLWSPNATICARVMMVFVIPPARAACSTSMASPAKWHKSCEVKFYHSDIVIYTLPPVAGFRNAVFGHFLHALENNHNNRVNIPRIDEVDG